LKDGDGANLMRSLRERHFNLLFEHEGSDTDAPTFPL